VAAARDLGGKANGAAVGVARPGVAARVSVGAVRRKRMLPYAAAGAVLVLSCALVFAVVAVNLGHRVTVLAVARTVWAGQPITAADLKAVPAADDGSLGLIPASEAASVLGRTPVVPLTPGTLLVPSMLGTPAFPPAGQLSASLALKPGQYPLHLSAGAHVVIFLTPAPTGLQPVTTASTVPADASSATGTRRITATVLDIVAGTEGQGGAVVELLLSSTDAARLAGTPTAGVVLMQTAPDAS